MAQAVFVAMAVQAGLSLIQGIQGAKAAKSQARLQAAQIDLDRSAKDAEYSQQALENVQAFRQTMATNEALFSAGGAALGTGTPQAFAEQSFAEINETLRLAKIQSNNLNASADLSRTSVMSAGRHRANASLIGGAAGAVGAFANTPMKPAGSPSGGVPVPVPNPRR